jgi:hypothetical protein
VKENQRYRRIQPRDEMRKVTTMRRTLVVALAFLMVPSVLSVGAQAAPMDDGKRSERMIELRYESGAIPYVICIDCPEITPRRGERFITVEVLDDLSPVGNVDVAWTTYNPRDPGYFNVCGKTAVPQRIPPSADLAFYPWMVPGQGCDTGFSTSGTIRITFSRHK